MAKIFNTSTDYLLDITDNPNPSDFKLTEQENNLLNNYKILNTEEKIKVDAYVQAILDIKNNS